MTTTELIELLKKHEHGGASGRPREVMICVGDEIYDINITGINTGDGLLAELFLEIDAQPERKKDMIQKFHDYQIEWLKSHYDIELDPQLEEMIVRFLHDTMNCYMREVEHETD